METLRTSLSSGAQTLIDGNHQGDALTATLNLIELSKSEADVFTSDVEPDHPSPSDARPLLNLPVSLLHKLKAFPPVVSTSCLQLSGSAHLPYWTWRDVCVGGFTAT